MDPKMEEAKGRAKEAAGALTGNDDLKAEGQADQASAKIHKAADKAADAAKDAVSKASGAVEGAIDKARDALK